MSELDTLLRLIKSIISDKDLVKNLLTQGAFILLAGGIITLVLFTFLVIFSGLITLLGQLPTTLSVAIFFGVACMGGIALFKVVDYTVRRLS